MKHSDGLFESWQADNDELMSTYCLNITDLQITIRDNWKSITVCHWMLLFMQSVHTSSLIMARNTSSCQNIHLPPANWLLDEQNCSQYKFKTFHCHKLESITTGDLNIKNKDVIVIPSEKQLHLVWSYTDHDTIENDCQNITQQKHIWILLIRNPLKNRNHKSAQDPWQTIRTHTSIMWFLWQYPTKINY